jgi:hypothetical protein
MLASKTALEMKISNSGLLPYLERQLGYPGLRIVDIVHGEFSIAEPLLIDLLEAQPLQRLQSVHQRGITGLLEFTPPITRYEPCFGAMVIVRKAGGSLNEQAFGLLHDVSHTGLSHVVDWVLSEPGTSYHEEHLLSYVNSTVLPIILTAHGLQLPECLDESSFPLVEQPSPHLCADRLDHTLRGWFWQACFERSPDDFGKPRCRFEPHIPNEDARSQRPEHCTPVSPSIFGTGS